MNQNTRENNANNFHTPPQNTRHNLQLARRAFHCISGLAVAFIYQRYLEHQQVVYILGTSACVLYFLEQIRINYPEYGNQISVFNKYFIRAEEHLKESASIPYIMAVLLTILSFPKMVALVAIYTLAVADPLSAIIGIRWGKHKIGQRKSVEGSLAFFIATFGVCWYVLYSQNYPLSGHHYFAAFLLAVLTTAFELIPLRIDDNLTIPLFTAAVLWPIFAIFSIPYN